MAKIPVDWTKRRSAKAREAEDAAARARVYLGQTDWLAVREAETGKPMPEDVRAARAAARKTISGE